MNMFERKGSVNGASKLGGTSSEGSVSEVEEVVPDGVADARMNDAANERGEVPSLVSDVAPSTKPLKLKKRSESCADSSLQLSTVILI